MSWTASPIVPLVFHLFHLMYAYLISGLHVILDGPVLEIGVYRFESKLIWFTAMLSELGIHDICQRMHI